MLRAGVIGLGSVGRRRAAAVQAHPGLALAATSDDAQGTAALLAQPLDLVFVCVPNDQAAPLSLAALERGLHVFCEKPPARSPAELAPVLALARQRQRIYMVGLNHRFHGSVQRLLLGHARGEWGPLRSLRGVYGKPGNQGWRTDPAIAGGGILLDQGIHLLDLMLLLAPGLVPRASVIQGAPLEEHVHALLVDADGVVADLVSSAREPRCIFRLEAVYTRARVTLDGILSGSMAYAPERLRIEAEGQPPREEAWTRDDSWAAEVAAMAAAVVDGTAAHGTPADAERLLRCIARIHEVGSG